MEPCKYRVEMPADGVYFCRCHTHHSRDNLVSERNCLACVEQHKDHPPPKWRPAPEINPTFLKRVANFFSAVGKHLSSGRKKASKMKQAQRLAICRDCEYYDGAKCQHKQCGCTRFEIKLSWADSECPDGRW